MVAEIEDLVERFGVRHVSFADANFMAHRQRVDSFCDLMIEKQVPVTWSATARADKLAMEDVPFAQKLRQAGCIKMAIGIESGSWEILNLIDKRTTPDMALKSNQLMAGAGIEGAYAFMTGFPKQLPAARHEVRQTLGLIRRIRKDHPDILTIVFYLTPYPGTPIYDLVKQFLTRRPERIEDWASWEAVSGETEWLSEDEKDLVQRCNNFYFPLAYPNRQLRSRMGKAAWIPVVYPLHFLARLRCALGYYRFPFEWRLANFFSRIPFVRKAISQVTAIHGY